jgi:hypothetical protein
MKRNVFGDKKIVNTDDIYNRIGEQTYKGTEIGIIYHERRCSLCNSVGNENCRGTGQW